MIKLPKQEFNIILYKVSDCPGTDREQRFYSAAKTAEKFLICEDFVKWIFSNQFSPQSPNKIRFIISTYKQPNFVKLYINWSYWNFEFRWNETTSKDTKEMFYETGTWIRKNLFSGKYLGENIYSELESWRFCLWIKIEEVPNRRKDEQKQRSFVK